MLLPLQLNLAPPLFTAMSPSHRAHFAEYRRWGYLSNGWDPVRRWNGYIPALELAGIVGPDQENNSWLPVPTPVAGVTTPGVHRVRFRWQDCRTGYVSNPSAAVDVNPLAGATKLTFDVEAAPGAGGPADIRLSTDAKVDRIVLEATVADGQVFFVAGIFALTEPVVLDIGDAALERSFRPWANDGHEPPPIGRWILSHRERLWIYGQVVHTTGNCTVAASVDVAAGSIDPDWRASALGDKTVVPVVFASVLWLLQIDGDDRFYEVDYYDEAANKLVLREAYAGVPASDVGYRLFTMSNVIWVSNPGFPEGFAPLTSSIIGPQGEISGEITATIGFGTALIVFTPSAMHRLTWDLGPQLDPVLVPVSTKYGALSQRVVVGVETTIYTMDRLGWHSFGGVRDQHMSREIDELLDQIDFDLLDLFHAVYLPRIRAIRWHFCLFGDVWPKHYAQWDLDTRSWGTGEFEVGITESTLRQTLSGPRVLLGDENGWLWFGETGTADGCRGEDSVLEVVGVPAPTAVNLYVTKQDLEVGTFGMAGSIAYWVEGDEFRYVNANTPISISVNPFSKAPESGDTILIGRVKARLKTKAFSGQRGPREVNRQDYFWILSNPTTEVRYALVRFFEDGSPVAKVDWGKDRRKQSVDGVDHPGTIKGLALSDWRVDLSKVSPNIPVGENFKHTLEVEIDFYWPDSRVEVFALELGGEDGTERLV